MKVKLADMGTACSIAEIPKIGHDIQTREYRSPEILLGANWDTTVDLWSLACMLFELGTGDYLFHPHTGPNWDKDEDHLAQMLELLGKAPRHITQNGKYCGDFFNSKGNLRHISKLKFWAVQDLLIEKYERSQNHALQFEKVLAPML